MALRIRRGTDAERQTITFAEGELVYTTDTKELYIGDGTTPGGILAGGDAGSSGINNIIEDVTPQLGGNLDLNNFEINGIGDIDITGTITADVVSGSLFVGDGSGLTNLPQSEGIVEGSNYRINIVGDNSTTIINTENNAIIANAINTGSITTFSISSPADQVIIQATDLQNINPQGVQVISKDSRGTLKFTRSSENDLSNNPALEYGSILFQRDDINGPLATSLIIGTEDALFFANNPAGTFATEEYYTVWKDNKFGIKKLNPEKTLDVNGDAIIRGDLTIESGSLLLENSLSTFDIQTPIKGQVIYNNSTDAISFYDGVSWYNVLKTEFDSGILVFDEPIILGKATTQERDLFGDDSTEASGGMFYNTTDDRFQFFQAGSWVSLINNGSTAGQMLAWNGAQWSAVDPEITAGTIENANTLNGFSGSYYLDYNNFTNTPIIPTVLTDLGIVDGTVGQVLTTNGVGNFNFTTIDGIKSRASLTGNTGSIANAVTANVNITGYKGYMLYKVQTSAAAWVRLYVSAAARTADAGRTQEQDPLPGSGVIAEVITTGAETVIIAPGVIGFNNELPVTNVIPMAVTNLSGSIADIVITLTAVEMEV